MKNYKAVLAGLALLAAPAVGLAAINIDCQGDVNGGPGWWMNVGTYSGAAATGNAGDVWNGTWYPPDWTGNVVAPLVDSNGNNTDIQWSSNWTRDQWSYDNGTSGALMGDYAFNNDAFIGDGSGSQFSLFTDTTALTGGKQITLGQQYNIYIYGAGDSAGSSTYKITTATGTQTKTINYAGGFDGTYTYGADYIAFWGVSPTATATGAEFAFEWGSDGASSAALNGIQIVAVPEPATIGLVGIFGAGVLFVRRRMMI